MLSQATSAEGQGKAEETVRSPPGEVKREGQAVMEKKVAADSTAKNVEDVKKKVDQTAAI